MSEPGCVMVRDAEGRWLRFGRPLRVVEARHCGQVVGCLGAVDRAVADGLWAAGFVGYEAAPACDQALQVQPDASGFPLLWFGFHTAPEIVPPPELSAADDGRACAWEPSISTEAYRQALKRIREYIGAGDTYQVNFTYRLRTVFHGDPHALFARLAAAQEAPYAAYVDTGRWVLASASPELFFHLHGTRIASKPMKGTARRAPLPERDVEQARRLRASAKERAENLMIVDMVRNDLGRIARPGSVRVPRLFAVERYPTVWQMTSTVEAHTDASLTEIFRATFPPASITGAPKARTMEIIRELECSPRRIYTGTIGFLAPGRKAVFNVAIRTALLDRETGVAEYGLGGGIVWDSDARAELEETRTKARILHAAPRSFQLLETLRWTPEEGFFLLELHLRRLARSAAYFGFDCDPAAVQAALADAVAAQTAGIKARLLLGRDGSIATGVGPLPAADPLPLRVGFAPEPVDVDDPFLYHKTTNREVYRRAAAACPECSDVILHNASGEITEATIANVFAEIDGVLCTPPVSCGLLAGTLREWLMDRGEVRERVMTADDLRRSPRVLLGNSVRGLVPVALQL